MRFLQRLSSKLMLIALLLVLLTFVGLFVMQSFRIRDMQAQYETAQAGLRQVQDRNAKLQDHLDFYNGPEYALYIEKVARESLGMAKPGETVILPISDNNGTLQNQAPTSNAVALNPATPKIILLPPHLIRPTGKIG
jgi:cell division protein DivIC